MTPKFVDPAINYYVEDVEIAVRFYTKHFGFVETLRTPKQGKPIHVEVRLGSLILGLASKEAGRTMHDLPLGPGGFPRAELAVWTENADEAYALLIEKGVPSVSAPHDFLSSLRAAWVMDPDGNPVEIVSRRMAITSTRISRHVDAPCANVYRALLDARAVATWMLPIGMTSHVHVFDPREGGFFRISLTYDEPTGTGKTTAHSDTYHGHFVKLVPNEQVVEVMEFETADAAMCGEMMVTFTLTDADGGTDVLAVHDNLPPGLSPTDNETGWRMALDHLAAFVEAGQNK